jgi:hypothetical protein
MLVREEKFGATQKRSLHGMKKSAQLLKNFFIVYFTKYRIFVSVVTDC